MLLCTPLFPKYPITQNIVKQYIVLVGAKNSS